MCGIATFVSSNGKRPGTKQVSLMLSHLLRRGDRSPEFIEFGNASFGCSRLAIVDIENGLQPFLNEDATVGVVFNGEIYNHEELADELQRAGHRFRSRCDTEVIVHGYEEWGECLAERLDGMYAFVVIDLKRKRALAARDPFGIKPLYYVLGPDSVYFASEIKALHRVTRGWHQKLNCQIQIVPPGGFVENGVPSSRVLFPRTGLVETSVEEAKARIRQLLRRSVASMLHTDLPVGILCSGGIDSSAVLYEAAQTSAEVTAYAIGVSTDSPDVQYAAQIARRLNVPFRPVIVSKESLLRSIPKVIEVIESFEPNHIRGGTLSYALAEAIHRDGIKIALCGEGADELFAGYPEFQEHLAYPDSTARIHQDVCHFTAELHKTQLQRVDRTNMAWSVEVRVPFLNRDFASYALSLPPSLKLRQCSSDGLPVAKWILREAYRGVLPDEIVDRPKTVLSEGAGVGDNSPRGPFFEYANRMLNDQDLERIQSEHPEFALKTKEEGFYFRVFRSLYGPQQLAAERPRVNSRPTCG